MEQDEALVNQATPLVSAALLELKHQNSKLNRENKQLNQNLVNVREVANQLVKTLTQLNELLKEREVTEKMKEQLEIGELLGQILDEGYSINEWTGRYLLAAKVEARELIKQAMAVAEMVSVPSPPALHPLLPKNVCQIEELPIQKKWDDHQVTYQSRLMKVAKTYESQCHQLRQELSEKQVSLN